jgi:hypothetical protein
MRYSSSAKAISTAAVKVSVLRGNRLFSVSKDCALKGAYMRPIQ